MGHALAAHSDPYATPVPTPQEIALRLALEEARRLAAQSQLLALNAGFESAAGRMESGQIPEMDTLGAQAGQAAGDAEQIVAAVERLLKQISSTGDLARPL